MNCSWYISYLLIETKFLLQSLTTDDAGNYICEVRRKNWKCWFFKTWMKTIKLARVNSFNNDWLIPAILFYLTSVAFQVENEGEPILQTNTLQILGDTKTSSFGSDMKQKKLWKYWEKYLVEMWEICWEEGRVEAGRWRKESEGKSDQLIIFYKPPQSFI